MELKIEMLPPDKDKLIDGKDYLVKTKKGAWDVMTYHDDMEYGPCFSDYEGYESFKNISLCGLLPK